MDAQTRFEARKSAIHLLRSGSTVTETANVLGYSEAWVYKWKKRFEQSFDFNALHEYSRAPKHSPGALSESVKEAIRKTRSELEAGSGLGYIGASAIRTRLKAEGIEVSRASIERVLKAANMTRPWQKKA